MLYKSSRVSFHIRIKNNLTSGDRVAGQELIYLDPDASCEIPFSGNVFRLYNNPT